MKYISSPKTAEFSSNAQLVITRDPQLTAMAPPLPPNSFPREVVLVTAFPRRVVLVIVKPALLLMAPPLEPSTPMFSLIVHPVTVRAPFWL